MKLPDYTLTISEPVACIKPGRTLLFRLCFALVLLIGIPAVGVLIWAEVTSFNLNSLPWLPRIGLAAVVGLCAFGVYRSIREEQVRLTLRFYKDRLVLFYEGKPSLWREGTPAEETVIRVADLSLDVVTHRVMRGNRRIDLQPLEFQLLEYLMRNKGRIVSKATIMDRVWDYHFDPHTNVVEVRVSRLRSKISLAGEQELIHTKRKFGYVLEAR